jgi:hypothetical protein
MINMVIINIDGYYWINNFGYKLKKKDYNDLPTKKNTIRLLIKMATHLVGTHQTPQSASVI